ncbi:hypothetical protein FNV43_RR27242 [Rhamnella rubrinervis]|uniref:Transmembrane protein n=1 Tax=Rhamnella rubrinervis TaxID=2594499 RepID=A0A8K0DWJ1_9ROSA|nr:hypothetical protein FNV43_RR27242 [Rhamnella rubrinervis]
MEDSSKREFRFLVKHSLYPCSLIFFFPMLLFFFPKKYTPNLGVGVSIPVTTTDVTSTLLFFLLFCILKLKKKKPRKTKSRPSIPIFKKAHLVKNNRLQNITTAVQEGDGDVHMDDGSSNNDQNEEATQEAKEAPIVQEQAESHEPMVENKIPIRQPLISEKKMMITAARRRNTRRWLLSH